MTRTNDSPLFGATRIPGWLRQTPEAVLASEDAVDTYAHVHGLPVPQRAQIEAERRRRAGFVIGGPHAD